MSFSCGNADAVSFAREAAMAGDLDKLQGTWRMVAFEADGEKMGAAMFAEACIIVKGDTFVSLGMGATYEGTLRVDAKKTPKHFDVVFTVGHAKGTRNLGIYRIVGGRWTLCLATRGATRPKTFATKPATGIALETLVRDGDAAEAPQMSKAPSVSTKRATVARPVESGPPTAIEGEWEMVAAVFNGKPMDANMVKWCTRITRGNLTTIVAGPQTMLKATFVLKPGKPHAAIEYMNLHGTNNGKAQAGIYELKGDSLQFCMSEPGKPAPSEFSSKPGDGRALTIWKCLGK
jgi:uncharacterized protein (TIGR03067 family)